VGGRLLAPVVSLLAASPDGWSAVVGQRWRYLCQADADESSPGLWSRC